MNEAVRTLCLVALLSVVTALAAEVALPRRLGLRPPLDGWGLRPGLEGSATRARCS